MISINPNTYQVKQKVSLNTLNTYEDFKATKKQLKAYLKQTRKQLGQLQDTMYAHGKYAVLICIQGMDTAGKDSLIREVFKDFNARGVVVHSFKVPTNLEKKHDYLWRHYIALPARGKFGVFNRTHYENTLVTRVHPYYILDENLPDVHSVNDIDENFWDKRFEQINNFEKTISQNGTIIFKFFLHLSKEEQRKRLLRRLEKKEKQWKFSAGDLKERALWDKYQYCYEDILNRTSFNHAPWYHIPADNKEATRCIVAAILLQTLQQYKDIKEPSLEEEVMLKIEDYKNQLQNEA